MYVCMYNIFRFLNFPLTEVLELMILDGAVDGSSRLFISRELISRAFISRALSPDSASNVLAIF